MTKRELSQLYYLKREIAQQKRRLAELEYAAMGVSSRLAGVPRGSGISDRVADSAAEITDLRALLEQNIQTCWSELNRLSRFISSVDNSLTRQILSLRYIDGLSWNQVAMAVGGGNTADGVRKCHDRFLSLQ